MKSFLLSSLFILAFLFVGCEKNDPSTVISGNIEKINAPHLLISHVAEGIVDTIFPDQKKILEYNFQEPLILTLSEGRARHYVYVKPGASIQLERNQEGGAIVANTPDSKENQYLLQFDELNNQANQNYPGFEIGRFEVDSFRLKIVEKYKELDAFIQEISADASVDDSFKKAMANRLSANVSYNYLSYEGIYNYHHKTAPDLPEDFYAPLAETSLDESLLLFEDGKSFGSQLNTKDLDFKEFPVLSDFFEAEYEQVAKTFSHPLLQKYYRLTALQNQVNFGSGIDGVDPLLAKFQSEDLNAYFAKNVEATLKPWINLKRGMKAPDFVGTTRDGKTVKLSELQGKSVYVDVWATWCGPCIAEIPALKELEKDLHDEAVEFVSVSIDQARDKEKWLTFIEEKELGGRQLFADGDWQSDVAKGYNIQGIPRFLLIGADGNIVSANAPRPSSASAKEMIEEGI